MLQANNLAKKLKYRKKPPLIHTDAHRKGNTDRLQKLVHLRLQTEVFKGSYKCSHKPIFKKSHAHETIKTNTTMITHALTQLFNKSHMLTQKDHHNKHHKMTASTRHEVQAGLCRFL